MEYLHHIIPTKNIAKGLQDRIVKYQVKKINITNIKGIFTDVNLKKATEIKDFTLSLQERDTIQSTYVNVFVQPQGKNYLFKFIEAICLAMSECSFLVFINFSADGVSVEIEDVLREIYEFWVGRLHILPWLTPTMFIRPRNIRLLVVVL